MKKILHELQRRNVLKAAVSYLVVAWVAIQVIDIIIPIFKISQGFEKWLILLLAIAFPFWLVFAYIYELTPTGFKKTSEVEKSDSIRSETNKSLNKYIIIGLSIVVLLLVFDRFYSISVALDTEIEEKSVAVLPFQNVSESEDAYFASGITEDILTQISKIEDIRVLSSLSLLDYDFKGKSPEEIGEELGVSYILMGNVRRSESNLRIGCQLIGTNNQGAVWAETFDKIMSNVFETQSEIAQKVAQSLDVQMNDLGEVALQKPTENMVAYDLYMRSRDYLSSRELEKMNKSIVLLKEAIELDPYFAEAYAQLSSTYSIIQNRTNTLPMALLDSAKVLAQKSLDLNPELPNGWHALGLVYNELRKPEESMAMYQKVLEFKPNDASALNNVANRFSETGDFPKAIKYYKKAIRVSPVNSINTKTEYLNLAGVYNQLAMVDRAMEAAQEALRLKDSGEVRLQFAISYAISKDTLKATEELVLAANFEENNLVMLEWGARIFYEYGFQELGLEYISRIKKNNAFDIRRIPSLRLYDANEAMKSGNLDQKEALLKEAINFYLTEFQKGNLLPDYVYELSQVYAMQNELEESMKWLNVMLQQGFVNRSALESVLYDNIQNEPAFIELCAKVAQKQKAMRDLVISEEMNTEIYITD